MNWLRAVILSKKFLPLLFVFFTLQAVFYAAYIGAGIPSDETYHFGAAKYYADQPITTGPFTHDQDPSTISVVRTIDRNPSYLFHYVLSFPMRALEALHASKYQQVLVLRLFDVVFALLSLYLIKKILDEMSGNKLVKNLTLLAFVLSGMAVWLAGSINYDNLANLLFLAFLYTALLIIKKPRALLILAALLLSAAAVLTKYVFLPVLGVGLITLLVLLKKQNYGFFKFKTQLEKSWRTKRYITAALIGGVLLFSGLFIERIGGNLVRYHSVEPTCTKFFTTEECRHYNVFNRNFRRKRVFNQEQRSGLIKYFNPFVYTADWTYTMYNTLYFQLGDRRFESELINRVFAALLAVALIVSALMSRARIRLGKSAGYVLFLSLFYTVLLFAYNLKAYVIYGQQYAFQGRYLLPVLGFLYFFMVLMVVNTYKNRSPERKKTFAFVWVAVAGLFFLAHFPPYLLSIHTDSSWHQEYILPPEIMD